MKMKQDSNIVTTKRKKTKKRRKNLLYIKTVVLSISILLILVLIFIIASMILLHKKEQEATRQAANISYKDILREETIQGIPMSVFYSHPEWIEYYLTPNEFSRPGDALEEVNSIFIHYTANPRTNARQNRSYFEQLGQTGERSASSHFIIGYNGEIVQCIPMNEIAYAVKTRNFDSVSIECCYIDDDGKFTQETYDSLILLLKWLVKAYDLQKEDILRHYDCGGKSCPLYYVENEEEWIKLKEDVFQ